MKRHSWFLLCSFSIESNLMGRKDPPQLTSSERAFENQLCFADFQLIYLIDSNHVNKVNRAHWFADADISPIDEPKVDLLAI